MVSKTLPLASTRPPLFRDCKEQLLYTCQVLGWRRWGHCGATSNYPIDAHPQTRSSLLPQPASSYRRSIGPSTLSVLWVLRPYNIYPGAPQLQVIVDHPTQGMWARWVSCRQRGSFEAVTFPRTLRFQFHEFMMGHGTPAFLKLSGDSDHLPYLGRLWHWLYEPIRLLSSQHLLGIYWHRPKTPPAGDTRLVRNSPAGIWNWDMEV